MGQSLFGHSESKFIVDGTEVFLSHSILLPEWQIPDYEINTSVFTGDRDFKNQGYYSRFVVQQHLYKDGNASASFGDIYQHNHKDVAFFPHWDGEPIKNADVTETASMHITQIKLGAVDAENTYDTLTITFDSNEYTSYRPKQGEGTINNPFGIRADRFHYLARLSKAQVFVVYPILQMN